MHSSTSSFRRPIPEAHWPRVGLITLVLVSIFMVGWEFYWRAEGYVPQYSDSRDIWASQRTRVSQGTGKETVIVGASRVRFDIDLDVWEQEVGQRPIQLGMNGTSAWPLLQDLASDAHFSGKVVFGVTEGLLFLPGFTGPAQNAFGNVRYYKNWSPSQRFGFILSKILEPRLAFMNGWDLNLNELIKRALPLENRPGALVVPPLPPLFETTQLDGRALLWDNVVTDDAFAQRIQQIWGPLFSFGPPLGGPLLDGLLDQIKQDVEKIRARGGDVIFVRLPSKGGLRDLENARWPREAFYERLLTHTGSQGIHFEDYETLLKYSCPEWSHISAADAIPFTRSLISIIRTQTDL
ncbi:MAG: hypothetical protein ACI8V2_001652 [Candidatus Latescibacterota bacterium]